MLDMSVRTPIFTTPSVYCAYAEPLAKAAEIAMRLLRIFMSIPHGGLACISNVARNRALSQFRRKWKNSLPNSLPAGNSGRVTLTVDRLRARWPASLSAREPFPGINSRDPPSLLSAPGRQPFGHARGEIGENAVGAGAL